MPKITVARAWANNEVAYVSWLADGKIPGCLGFEVTRVHLESNGAEKRVKCAAWVAFEGQHNRDWIPQDTGVWPVQKFSWRDLTVRKRRSGMTRRPSELTVRYEVRPVGNLKAGMTPVPSNGLERTKILKRDAHGKVLFDEHGKPIREDGPAYSGKPRPLGYLDEAVTTNEVLISAARPPFRSTFTNGILAAQWLRNVLEADGVIEKNELLDKISDPKDPHRKYLAGDVIPTLREFMSRAGRFHLALYELEDQELEGLILEHRDQVEVILANSGADDDGAWDVRNAPARARLREALGDRLQDRMFNNSIHIGHNKFVVHVDASGQPVAVLTGSTNWTSTGVAGQTNNALVIEDPAVAQAFLDYWQRMRADALPAAKPLLSSTMKDSRQSAELRAANETSAQIDLGAGREIHVWFSPNRPERKKPTSKRKPPPVPPDLQEVYRLMRLAKDAVLFLAFYPGQRGVDCMIGEAIEIGRKDPQILVAGAVSSAQAMPNYVAEERDDDTDEVLIEGESPSTFDEGNVTIVRAARIDDHTLLGDLGVEQLTAKGGIGAIIHDKIVVIDPRSDECVVILGSHNLGYKASYSNDENMLIVKGHRDLAMAYAVHVLDVYDHYRFRAAERDLHLHGKDGWSGFLETNDDWQDRYVSGKKGALARYLAR